MNGKDRFTLPMYRSLWGPAMLSSIGWALSDMADAVVVGQKLGTVGLAAIGLILPIYMINCAVVHGFGIGGSIQFSKLLGAGQNEEAKKNFSSITLVAFFISVLTAIIGLLCIDSVLALLGTVKSDGMLFKATKDYLKVLLLATPLFYLSNLLNYYLRNDEEQKRAGIGSVVGNIVDITCNITFVIVFEWGTFGAALSTAIGQIVSISIYLPALWNKNNHLKLCRIQWENICYAFSCMKLGAATSVKYLYQVVFFLICNNVLIRMGGENGVAVFDLIQNTSYLILYLYEGTARAMQPLISTYQGEHNLIGKKNICKIGFISGNIVGLLLIAYIVICPSGLCHLFGISGTEVEHLAYLALRIYAFGAIFAGMNILICNYYQSCEQEKASFFIETLRGAIILLPLTVFFANLQLEYFWWLFPCTEISCFLLFLLFKKRFIIQEIDNKRVFQKIIQGNENDIGFVIQEVNEFCEIWEGTIKQQYFITMTIEELCLAILTHGFQGKSDGYIQITLIALENKKFEVHLRDNAVEFNPFALKDNKVNDIDADFNAMGVMVIKKQSEEFFYRRYQGFNSLILRI
ncbi:MAG: MATE family efflux transporter [Lachnospiraceae bacterium]|nr:MATE family efflux transporter [Lachnospiraceae bacterium]